MPQALSLEMIVMCVHQNRRLGNKNFVLEVQLQTMVYNYQIYHAGFLIKLSL